MPVTLAPPAGKRNDAGGQRTDDTPPRILYLDHHFVAVDKPPGMLVHRSRMAAGEPALLQAVRDRLGERLFPVHRLDRATAGVLVLGRSADAAGRLAALFRDRKVRKEYLALVRGYAPAEGVIDYPLADAGGCRRQAITRFQCLARVELPVRITRYATSRYSLVRAAPETGRRHQIRRHFHHIFHPVIGDTTHGEGRHNRLFRERYGVGQLLLLARRLTFDHPFTGRRCEIAAPLGDGWRRLFDAFSWREGDLEYGGD